MKMNAKFAVLFVASLSLPGAASAETFNIPGGSLASALDAYSAQSGVPVAISAHELDGARSRGASGDMSADAALMKILSGTGFAVKKVGDSIAIVRSEHASIPRIDSVDVAAATAPAASSASLETVTVTSSKIGGDVQNIPISITALSQEQLTATQTTGGPDLVKQVPNLTFTKTNFTGYSIQIRGIGTQAISVTTDPAVAVAFNDIPFIRNHFFEQEFYDVSQVEVVRGPQGTLYGRNATAGVVNLVSAKPTDQFEAVASADIGNYQNRRLEGMVNIPIVDDRLDLRVAGEWTKRNGYSFNETTDSSIDGRDLWSSRVTMGLKPTSALQMYLIWEHFQEGDDRLRSGKQLCKTDPGVGSILGAPKPLGVGQGFGGFGAPGDFFDQGCLATSLYSPEAFQAPNGWSLPYITGLQDESNANNVDPYASEFQSHNLRDVESGLNPDYKAKNDVVELNADYAFTPALTFTSQTGFDRDFLFSSEDYNRFGASAGLFRYAGDGVHPDENGTLPDPNGLGIENGLSGNGTYCTVGGDPECQPVGYVCDPQVGCSDHMILEDLSDEKSWQLSQEFRVASNFSGPFNFSAGGNYLHYETVEDYYVFGNVLTLIDGGYIPGRFDSNTNTPLPNGFQFNDPNQPAKIASGYVDPNPISQLDGNGHNYFRSENPYVLNSYAAFGEVYYNLTEALKLTGGLRWTDDQKHFLDIPSWLVDSGWGYPIARTVNQQWKEMTGRAVVNWTPKLDFTDQTLVYGSYSHGYKAGGANPPGAEFSSVFQTLGSLGDPAQSYSVQPVHPLTFKPEFIDAFELGTKNTLLDGALTLNGDVFYYNYRDYQISEIVDRTAINQNFNATVNGAELETSWEPLPGLKFNFGGGYEDTRIANGQSAVDLMDRTAGNPNWFVVRPFVNEASNCILPAYVAKWITNGAPQVGAIVTSYCALAYDLHLDPLSEAPYQPNPTFDPAKGGPLTTANGVPITNYPGFDPLAGTSGDPYTGQNVADGVDYGPVPNNGTGFAKNLGGNQLPNAPHFTTSFSAEYTMPITDDWAATLHGDFYWQSQSWWRVFNDKSFDELHGYSNVNATLILTGTSGWQVMGYVKNIFNTTAITGAFLNSDDSGLTTNIFLTDPRLFGVRVTKNW